MPAITRRFMLPASIKTRYFVYHSHAYGIATLMRIGFVFPSGRKLLLHHFRPHAERDFHDHPWSFRTLVLWGSYVDESLGEEVEGERLVIRDVLRMGSSRRRDALHAHRTSCSGHVWTLVLTSPPSRDWCQGSPRSWVCEGVPEDFDATRGMPKTGAA